MTDGGLDVHSKKHSPDIGRLNNSKKVLGHFIAY